MAVLELLEPRRVFAHFEALSAIPRGSGCTEQAAAYCVDFAKAHGLAWQRDEGGNVVLYKGASPGYEMAPGVILQGHLDMVCEQAADCRKDMAREGLDLFVEGDLVGARGTTLGGDDGIAVAMALAVLEDDALPHPALEALFTADEEVGMLGAAALDGAMLHGRRLINLDSESEGIFTVSCAGGNRTDCVLPVRRADFEGERLTVAVDGLSGGHSGEEIHRGRGNAVKVLSRVLAALDRTTELRLTNLSGGGKDNAIPRQAQAEIAVADGGAVRAAAAKLAEVLAAELADTDPGFTLTVRGAEEHGTPMDKVSTGRVLALLEQCPNGVVAMSGEMPGLVQTSLNLGILNSTETAVTAVFCIRSSVNEERDALTAHLAQLTKTLGGTTTVRGAYPAWEYRPHSPLRTVMTEVFQAQYGHPPRVEAIHAGLECGLLCGKLPGLDVVSCGPELTDIHTPRERMSVASVARLWAFLREVLRHLG